MGALVQQAGRPVLIVPGTIDKLVLGHVIVAWKDTRETRRAALDALPLLKMAARVTVVEVAAEGDLESARLHLEDVVVWLKRHDIAAALLVSASNGDDTGRLNAIAQEQNVDLIVAGAYGHSRLRELVLGGVTHDLLLCPGRCVLVSH
jgi:nucleotide-binding universal stress UspA family protein